MSIIPLVIEGPNPTVVSEEAKFRYDGSAMLILDLDTGQLQGKQSSATRAMTCE